MTHDEKKKAIVAYLTASANQDIDGMASFLTHDFHFWTVPSAREHGLPCPIVGRQQYIAFVRHIRENTNKWKVREYAPEQFLFDEDSVAVRLRSIGDFPNGFLYENEYVFIYKFSGEKICEIREFTDVAYINILRQRAAAHSG